MEKFNFKIFNDTQPDEAVYKLVAALKHLAGINIKIEEVGGDGFVEFEITTSKNAEEQL